MARLRSFELAMVLAFAVPLLHAQTNVATVQFTTIDVPGASVTSINAINAVGDMVGWYANSSSGPYHAFLLSGGNFTFFDYPGSVSTLATSINDSGLIAGFDGDVNDNGFLYDGITFTTIQAGNRTRNFIYGINNSGTVVGGAGTPSTTRALELSNGKFKGLNFPGSYVYAYGTAVNNLGEVVGYTTDGFSADAYLYKNGQIRNIDFSGATQTEAWGVNDNGIIVGYYEKGPPYVFHSFVLKNGKYISFDYPGAQTFAQGINTSGQIVGTYTSDFQTYHGFVTSPVTNANFQ
jgi:probable HAF family extracellular repeat protein